MSQRNVPMVLVVDDDPAIRLMAREVLALEGFDVVDADRGDTAVECFLSLRPDIVMLDVVMPGLDGFQVCAALRELPGGESIPVVMMTGMNDDDSVKRAYEAGATQFISKPVHWVNLGHQMNYILRAKKTYEKLRVSEARLAEAQRIAGIGSWELDTSSGEMHWSEEVFRIFGMEGEHAGACYGIFRECLHPLDRMKVAAAMRRVLSGSDSLSLECRIINRKGRTLDVHAEAQIRRDTAGHPIQAVGYVQDVTERRRDEEKIRRLAYFDSLTGLPNRVHFTDHFDQALMRTKRMNRKLSILFVDLDRFKRINDNFGHSVGDELLKQVAHRLSSSVRTSDQVARESENGTDVQVSRLAGDEFLVLLENIREYYDAAKVAQRILSSISAPFYVDGSEIHITPCIGISLYPLDGMDQAEMIRHADMAMYKVKMAGGNNFRFYSDEFNSVAVEHIDMENRLRTALAGDEFSLRFQPVLDMENGSLVCVEALLRWDCPEKGVQLPADFLPFAEKCGLGNDLDEWVLTSACNQLSLWRRQEWSTFRVSVNISGVHSRSEPLVSLVDRVLADTGMDPSFLDLEFTEDALLKSGAGLVETLRCLKDKGIRLSVDDFGAGHSSLNQLKRFPIDILKIDRFLIGKLLDDGDSRSLVCAIIAVSRALGLETVAAGVEQQEQREFLLRQGCGKMQGYLISPPMTASELESFVRDGSARAR
ncbi:MAG: EAL domain-containing protein [Geobacteraceae bacterium]|nr:EAL domain-containing protein [Geobacteraceae bacterium]